MSKSNDKKNRTNGVMPSSNMELPNPLTSCNDPSAGNTNNNKNRQSIYKDTGLINKNIN